MRRVGELDGLRGMACLSVLVAHYFGEVAHGYRLLAFGWAGVDLFFCLSGFLIGGILLDNRESDSYFKTFYIRRAFRIFPIYYVTIISLLLFLGHVSWAANYTRLPAASIWYLTYSQNLLFAIRDDAGGKWLLPTWTLCVEEQFYLLLPMILYFCPRRFTLRMLIALIASASIFRVGLAMAGAGEVALYVLLPSRWDLLFLGVLGAYVYRDQNLWTFLMAEKSRNLKVLILLSALTAALLSGLDGHFELQTFSLFGNLFVGAALTGYIVLIISGAPEGARFRGKYVRFFGSISYGLYLVHQPIAGIMHAAILNGRPDIATLAQLVVTIGAAGMSIAVAYLSWAYFERPLVEIGHRWAYAGVAPARSLAAMS